MKALIAGEPGQAGSYPGEKALKEVVLTLGIEHGLARMTRICTDAANPCKSVRIRFIRVPQQIHHGQYPKVNTVLKGTSRLKKIEKYIDSDIFMATYRDVLFNNDTSDSVNLNKKYL